MISRKIAFLILALLIVGGALLACCSEAKAQTAPTWIGTDLTAGKQKVAGGVVSATSRRLSMIQIKDPASWAGTFWGRVYAYGTPPDTVGTWTRISPQTGSAATDTLLEVSSGSPFFRFTGIPLEVIITDSGTATFWGE